MPTKTEVATIGNTSYSITQWPADKSLIMKFKLIKIAGSVLVELLTKEKSNSADMEAVFMEAFVNIMNNTNASPESLMEFIKECVTTNNVRVEGVVLDYAGFISRFSGDDLVELYQLVGNVIKVNYAGLMQGRAKQAADVAEQSTPQNTQT